MVSEREIIPESTLQIICLGEKPSDTTAEGIGKENEMGVGSIYYIADENYKLREGHTMEEMVKIENELRSNGCPKCEGKIEDTRFSKDGAFVTSTYCQPCNIALTMSINGVIS